MLFNDEISQKSIAEPNTILRGLVGSTVHGLVLSGTDDRDEMGVCLEPRRYDALATMPEDFFADGRQDDPPQEREDL
jgi:hypothetical protein